MAPFTRTIGAGFVAFFFGLVVADSSLGPLLAPG